MVQVLLVDSEPDLFNLFKAGLGQVSGVQNIAIDCVATAHACLALLERHTLHQTVIVLSDLNMPEMEHAGLLKVIQKRFPQVKVYICTAEQTPFIRKSSDEKGALRFFSKPVSISDFCGALIEDFSSI
ncbi:MAG: response regulator [Bacillota bacterium]